MKPGRVVAGRYQLDELLGSGEMGAVYAARDVDGTPLAIKVLHKEVAKLPGTVERFQREAINARKIQSPHVARVVAAGSNGNRLWIAFERLVGETLEARLRRERSVAAGLASRIFGHLLDGLEAGHAVGVVHRDVKPGNIFLVSAAREPELRACLLDFGISKHRPTETSAPSPALTGTADILGSIRYMAPEQIGDAARADARADGYAAVTVLFQMLTGALPFAGKSRATVLVAKLNDRAFRPSEVTGAAWPESVEAFFQQGLARNPDDRIGTAAELKATWGALVSRARLPTQQTFDPEIQREYDPDDFQADRESNDGSTVRR